MLLQSLREQVLEANLDLVRQGLVFHTFGNASGLAREQGLVAIKPSGVPYESLRPEHMVITDLQGKIVEGDLRPSSDLDTHLEIYRNFPAAGGVAHTHSEYATAWAQARRPIPCLGTTHADHFHGEIPVTPLLTPEEIAGEYELNTGVVICRAFRDRDPAAVTAVLVASHGPFCWGPTAQDAAHTAGVVELLARTAYYTLTLNGHAPAITRELHDRHFLRKHGKDAYYGQKKGP